MYACDTKWYKIVPAIISIVLGAVGLVSTTLGWKYIAHMITILVAAFGYVVWITGKILCALGVVGNKLVRQLRRSRYRLCRLQKCSLNGRRHFAYR